MRGVFFYFDESYHLFFVSAGTFDKSNNFGKWADCFTIDVDLIDDFSSVTFKFFPEKAAKFFGLLCLFGTLIRF